MDEVHEEKLKQVEEKISGLISGLIEDILLIIEENTKISNIMLSSPIDEDIKHINTLPKTKKIDQKYLEPIYQIHFDNIAKQLYESISIRYKISITDSEHFPSKFDNSLSYVMDQLDTNFTKKILIEKLIILNNIYKSKRTFPENEKEIMQQWHKDFYNYLASQKVNNV